MGEQNHIGVSQSANAAQARPPTVSPLIVPAIDVVREGRPEPFLDSRPTRSSAPSQWGGIALEKYTVPAVFMPRQNFSIYFTSGHYVPFASGDRG